MILFSSQNVNFASLYSVVEGAHLAKSDKEKYQNLIGLVAREFMDVTYNLGWSGFGVTVSDSDGNFDLVSIHSLS